MISTRGRYALRMMVDLARHQGEGFVALKDIARRQDLSKKYLEQIIPVLNRAAQKRLTDEKKSGPHRAKRQVRIFLFSFAQRQTCVYS